MSVSRGLPYRQLPWISVGIFDKIADGNDEILGAFPVIAEEFGSGQPNGTGGRGALRFCPELEDLP
jgi:hypothetical protein